MSRGRDVTWYNRGSRALPWGRNHLPPASLYVCRHEGPDSRLWTSEAELSMLQVSPGQARERVCRTSHRVPTGQGPAGTSDRGRQLLTRSAGHGGARGLTTHEDSVLRTRASHDARESTGASHRSGAVEHQDWRARIAWGRRQGDDGEEGAGQTRRNREQRQRHRPYCRWWCFREEIRMLTSCPWLERRNVDGLLRKLARAAKPIWATR